MDGGKRLRPAFCYWGYLGAGGDPSRRGDHRRRGRVRDAAGLRSRARRRHGRVLDAARGPHRTPRVRRPARRRRLARRGTAVRRGRRHPHRRPRARVRGSAPAPHLSRAVQAVWDELRVELNVGQYLDLVGTARADTDHESARRIARYKSGKYTIERPLHIGAALAGRLDDLEAPLSAYGDPLGEAFQLRDDLLGAFGDEAVTGKPVGDDLREGKPTPLLAAATANADAAQASVLGDVGRATSPPPRSPASSRCSPTRVRWMRSRHRSTLSPSRPSPPSPRSHHRDALDRPHRARGLRRLAIVLAPSPRSSPAWVIRLGRGRGRGRASTR